jgi:hypothetical protein
MHGRYGNPNEVLSEIGGRFRQGTDTIVSPPLICAYFRVKWPHKTAANLAAFANQLGFKSCTERTAARWLSGEHDVPLTVAFAFALDSVKRMNG